MITKDDLAKRYSEYSLSQLLEVIENKHNYTDIAVLVAIEEIGRRNVTEDEIAQHKEDQIQSVVEKAKRNYVDRLSIWQKHFFFFMWIPLLTFPFKQNLYEDGYEMKLRQARYFSLLGFVSMAVATFATIQLKLTDSSFWLILIPEFAITLILDGVFNPVYILKEPEKEHEEDSSS